MVGKYPFSYYLVLIGDISSNVASSGLHDVLLMLCGLADNLKRRKIQINDLC